VPRGRDANVIASLDHRTLSQAQVTRIVSAAMTQQHVTGLGVAVINHADIVYIRGFGYRNVATKAALTDQTVMDAGSLAQPLLAYLVMQLVDRRTLELDTPVPTYLGSAIDGYPDYKGLARDERYQRITIRMLLDHTSGLANFPPLGSDSIAAVRFDPGTQYSYSNEGLTLLGLVVEHVTKRPLNDVMRDEVFKPLGMTHTTLVPVSISAVATRYDAQGNPVPTGTPTISGAGGSVYSTLDDMAKFVRTLLGHAWPSPRARMEMLKPQVRIRSARQLSSASSTVTASNDKIRLSHGLGWGVFMSPYGPAFFADGRGDGMSHYIVAFDDAKTALLLMSNSANGARTFTRLLDSLIGDTYTPATWLGYGASAPK